MVVGWEKNMRQVRDILRAVVCGGAVLAALPAWGQGDPRVPPRLVLPAMPEDPPVRMVPLPPIPADGRGQVIAVQGGAVRILVGNDGQLIVVPVMPADVTPENMDLPLVSAGFANDADVKGGIGPLVEKLEAASYRDREEASEALLRLPPGRLPEVVEALKKEKDEEAIARLTDVAAHLFLKPRTNLKARESVLGVWGNRHDPALLGLKFEPQKTKIKPTDEAETMTVMVMEIQPGFPAMQTLRAGDRIVAIDGKGFPGDMTSEGFRDRIGGLWPGAATPLLVLRDGKVVELKVQTTCVPLPRAEMQAYEISNEISNMIARRDYAVNAFLESIRGRKDQASARAQEVRSSVDFGSSDHSSERPIPAPSGGFERQ